MEMNSRFCWCILLIYLGLSYSPFLGSGWNLVSSVQVSMAIRLVCWYSRLFFVPSLLKLWWYFEDFFSSHFQGCIVPFSGVIWKLYERNSLLSFITGYAITIVFDVFCSLSVAHYSCGIWSLAVLHMDGQTTLAKNYRNHWEIILTKPPPFLQYSIDFLVYVDLKAAGGIFYSINSSLGEM